jgi:hypothetical protein
MPAPSLYGLQNASGVDQNISGVIKCGIGVSTRLDLDLPLPFLIVPPSPLHSMLHLDISTEVMFLDNILKIPENFRRSSVVATPIRFGMPGELIIYRRLADKRSQSSRM